MLLAALAWASPRADGDAAEAGMDFGAALVAYRSCAAGSDDRDARYCEVHVRTLAPQEADGFVGWRLLAEVRREYRALGSDAAIARIEAALAAHPESPAAGEMWAWLANERARRGETDAVVAMTPSLPADVKEWAEARVRDQQLERVRRRVAAALGAVGLLYVGFAAMRVQTLRWRSAAIAALALGAVPATFAYFYEDGLADGFVRSGAVVALGVLLAGRAPPWIAVPGTLGGLGAVAWFNG